METTPGTSWSTTKSVEVKLTNQRFLTFWTFTWGILTRRSNTQLFSSYRLVRKEFVKFHSIHKSFISPKN